MAIRVSADQLNAFARHIVRSTVCREVTIGAMELFLTTECTLRCDYCFVDKCNPQRMSWNIVKKAIDLLMERSGDLEVVEITFFGGEPLLEFGLMKRATEYAQRYADVLGKTISFAVTTNGTIMNEEIASFGQAHNINFLLSIDGVKEAHDQHRVFPAGRKGSWDIVTGENFRLLRSFQGWMGARMTVRPDTVHYLSAGVRQLFGMGVNQFIIGCDKSTEWMETHMNTFASEMNAVVDFYLECVANKLPLRIASLEGDLDKRRSENCNLWGCGAGRGRIAVSAEGDIYPCSQFAYPVPALEGYKIGNVDVGLTDIDVRACFEYGLDRRPECIACDVREYCRGGCPATNLLNGSACEPHHMDCFHTKLFLKLLDRVCSGGQGLQPMSAHETAR